MASLICRNAKLRNVIARQIFSLNHFNSSASSFHSQIVQHHAPPPLSVPNEFSVSGAHSIGGRFRFFCSSTVAATTVNPPTPATKVADEGKSEGEKNSDGGNKSEEGHQSGEEGKSVRGGPVSWLSFLLLVITGGGVIWYYDKEKKRHIEEINSASSAVKQGPSVGKAAIGGPFNLINHEGKRVTQEDFKGKWSLVYFGFTHCPDICPDELQKLAAAIDKIKEKARIEVVPVFISVDPERDTVEQVGEYVKEFHPKLIGLTGNDDEVKAVARAYRVYYMKTYEEDSDYLVDHSIIMYLMDPNMEFVKFFGKNHDVDSLTDGVIQEIKQYKRKK